MSHFLKTTWSLSKAYRGLVAVRVEVYRHGARLLDRCDASAKSSTAFTVRGRQQQHQTAIHYRLLPEAGRGDASEGARPKPSSVGDHR